MCVCLYMYLYVYVYSRIYIYIYRHYFILGNLIIFNIIYSDINYLYIYFFLFSWMVFFCCCLFTISQNLFLTMSCGKSSYYIHFTCAEWNNMIIYIAYRFLVSVHIEYLPLLIQILGLSICIDFTLRPRISWIVPSGKHIHLFMCMYLNTI